MPTLDDLIEIETKIEKFMCVKLEIPEIPGISDKVHMHVLRLDRFEREIIPLVKIIRINNKEVSKPVTEWKVAGSKGSQYIVKFTGAGYKCTCAGFRFKKKCSHIDTIKLTK